MQKQLLNPINSKRNIGRHYETFAAQYLEQQGLKILQRNFTCKLGEIDLVLQDQETIVFAEVRFRKNKNHGPASSTVDYKKQKKCIHSALVFLQCYPKIAKKPCRFDVIALSRPEDPRNANPSIEWIKNAFQA